MGNWHPRSVKSGNMEKDRKSDVILLAILSITPNKRREEEKEKREKQDKKEQKQRREKIEKKTRKERKERKNAGRRKKRKKKERKRRKRRKERWKRRERGKETYLSFQLIIRRLAQIRRIFLDGYGVLDVRTAIFKCLRLSSRMRACLLIFTKDTLHLPVETLENPFSVPTDLKYIPRFLKTVGYEGIVDKASAFYTKNLDQPWQTMFKVFNRCLTTRTTQKKDSIQYPHFIKLIIVDLIKKFPSIAPRLDEHYHSIKDDVPFGSMYTIGNVTVRGMLIPSKLLTDKIYATKEYKAYEEKFFRDEEDTGTRIEPKSHKEHLEIINDYEDDVEKEKKDDEKNDDENNDDNALTELSLDKTLSEELMANVSPRPDTTSKEPSMSQPTSSTHKILPNSVAVISRRSGQLREQLKDTFITKEYFKGKMKEMSDNLNIIVPELTVDKTNELIKEAIPRMVNDTVNKDREIFAYVVPELVAKEFATRAPKILKEFFKRHMKNKVLHVHPITSIPTAKTTTDLKQQLYLKMKSDLQAQAADPKM
ncbi:hypothetical protein Tco_0723504 [Tanacetum coccineum]